MKRILYLLFLLFFVAGCQKEEVTETLKVAKVNFSNNTNPQVALIIKYNGEIYEVPGFIPVIYGDRTFEVFARTGEKITEGTFTISGNINYYIYQPDATVKPTILTVLPPPPPPPAGPLDDATAAPTGYMKVKIVNASQVVLGDDKIDVEVFAQVTSATYELFTTIRGVTTTIPNDFVQFQRPVRAGVPQTNFKFRFLNSITQEPVKTSEGAVYLSATPLSLSVREFNVFLVNIVYSTTTAATGIPKDGLLYTLRGSLVVGK